MRTLFLTLLTLALAFSTPAAERVDVAPPLPSVPGDHKLVFRTRIGNKPVQLSYLLRLPPAYADASRRLPVMVFFHGVGECGTDLNGVYFLGPLQQTSARPKFAASFPFIVIAPQCPPRGERWETPEIYAACAQLVEQVVGRIRCDPDRVVATGLSMGADGAWYTVLESPQLFAAVAPLSGMACKPEVAGERLRFVNVWSVSGAGDEPRFVDGTRQMEAALKDSPCERRFTYLQNEGHVAYNLAYENPQFYEWLLAQRRPSAAERKAWGSRAAAAPATTKPTRPGHYLLHADLNVGEQPYRLDYLLYLPKAYHATGTASPALVFFHEQETIGADVGGFCPHGPDLELERRPALRESYPFVVVSPRLPVKLHWDSPGIAKAMLELVGQISADLNVDKSRVSVTGLNAGAVAAMNLVAAGPERFAAVAPVAAEGPVLPDDAQAAIFGAVPGWAVVRDSEGPSVARLKSLVSGTKLEWWVAAVPGSGDDLPVYRDARFNAWLAKQKKR